MGGLTLVSVLDSTHPVLSQNVSLTGAPGAATLAAPAGSSTVTGGAEVAGPRGPVGYTAWSGYTGSLTAWPGGNVATSGTYDNYHFTAGISITAADVTLRGCFFEVSGASAACVVPKNTGITLEYCTFAPTTVGTPTAYANGYQYGWCADGSFGGNAPGATLDHCDIYGFGNAVDIQGGSASEPILFTDCWIHDPRDPGGTDHTDGLGTMNGADTSHVTVTHCTIEAAANTNAIAFQGGTHDHLTVTWNRFGGYGFTCSVYSTVTNAVWTDNVYSTEFFSFYGPFRETNLLTSSGLVWRRNTWEAKSGYAWGNPAHDGWYWMPVSADIEADRTNDSPFVSLTDYTG